MILQTTHKKIIDRREKRREGVHKFMDKNILPLGITELNSWGENQRNISQTARQSTKTRIIFVI